MRNEVEEMYRSAEVFEKMDRAQRIMEIMREHTLYGEVYEDGNVVAVEIPWGDWKHDHLRLEYWVKELMPELKKMDMEVTEEDGSDCYSAIHRFYF